MERRLFSTKEAATLLQAHPHTIRAWVREGSLEHGLSLGGHLRFTVDHLNPARKRLGLPPLTDEEAIQILAQAFGED